MLCNRLSRSQLLDIKSIIISEFIVQRRIFLLHQLLDVNENLSPNKSIQSRRIKLQEVWFHRHKRNLKT